MAGQLLLVNPRKRRKTRKYRRNPTAPAAPRKKRRVSAKTRVKRGYNKARRTAGKAAKRAARGASKFFTKVRRGARRSKRKSQSFKQIVTNPGGFLQQTVMPAAVGAVGALALDAGYAYLPIPANIKNGALAPVVKIGTVGLLGAAVAHFAPQRMVRQVHTAVAASITIIAYGWLKSRIQQALPNVRLGEFLEDDTLCPIPGVTPLAYYQAGQFLPGMGEYVSEYVSGNDEFIEVEDDLGYSSALDFGPADSEYLDDVS